MSLGDPTEPLPWWWFVVVIGCFVVVTASTLFLVLSGSSPSLLLNILVYAGMVATPLVTRARARNRRRSGT